MRVHMALLTNKVLFWSCSALIGGESSGAIHYALQIQIPATVGGVLQKKGPARCLPCVPQKMLQETAKHFMHF